MSATDWASRAQTIADWLVPLFPYLVKGATIIGSKWLETMGAKSGEETIKQLSRWWKAVKQKYPKDMENIARILAEEPQNEAARQNLVRFLTKMLSESPDIFAQLLEIYRTLQQSSGPPARFVDQRSGGVYFSNSGAVSIGGDVVGGNQEKTS